MAGRGEAASEAVSDEAALARHEQTGCGVGDLLGQALARENMARAWKRVKANKVRISAHRGRHFRLIVDGISA